jgi:hypothetical protein
MEQSRRESSSSQNNDTFEEIGVRQLILSEYRSGNTEEQARINIQTNLGSVAASTITHWYKRFKSDKISLFENYYIPPAIQTLSNLKFIFSICCRKTHLTLFYLYLKTSLMVVQHLLVENA